MSIGKIERDLDSIDTLGELKDYLARIGVPDSAPISVEVNLYGQLLLEMDIPNNILSGIDEDDDEEDDY